MTVQGESVSQPRRGLSVRGPDRIISLASPIALLLIWELAARFGSQCVVVGIDSRAEAGGYSVYQFTGSPEKTRSAGLATTDWVQEVQERGAGEIVLNCMNQDGVRRGYDIDQLRLVRGLCHVPLIASGGAGRPSHLVDVFRQGKADAGLVASMVHYGTYTVPAIKDELAKVGIPVRGAA